MKLKTWMASQDACSEALAWVGDRTPAEAWAECKRGDWMLWALARTDIDRRELVRICCDAALSVLPLTDDPCVAACIDAAEGWCAGEVTNEQLLEARLAAAYAAYYAANAAYYAANAAADAAAYAAYAAWGRARTDALAEIADLVCSRITPKQFADLVKA